jgi:hypothetical protein
MSAEAPRFLRRYGKGQRLRVVKEGAVLIALDGWRRELAVGDEIVATGWGRDPVSRRFECPLFEADGRADVTFWPRMEANRGHWPDPTYLEPTAQLEGMAAGLPFDEMTAAERTEYEHNRPRP